MIDDATAPAHPDTRAQRVLVVVGIVVVAFNLRPAAVSVGPVLDEIITGLGMTSTTAGVLTTLPVLSFAAFGALAPWLARVLGLHRITLLALVSVVVGLALRSQTANVPLFLLLSLVALAGMATTNVLLPSLVKLHFPDRVGLMTSIYTTSLAVGLTLSSVLTVPLSEHFGSWRWGLFAWAVTALVAALPWIGLVRHDSAPDVAARGISLGAVARTRLGWGMALFFGFQSLQAYSVFGWFAQVYRDAGFSPGTAGLLLGVITAMSIPLSFWLPSWAARMEHQTWLIVGLVLCYPVGYVGLIVAPVAGAWLWAVLVGVAASVFPVVLTLIGLRARTAEGTAALSGFTQSVGYLIAAIGPFGMGLTYELTGGWTVPLIGLIVLVVPQLLAGLMVARPSYIEDAIGVRTAG
ncbi:MFS transporter [Nocardioides panacis]|uniref:MFS transporter n=1 Tax=Nocardioides panacis TaxID=2849501 RepID=A0A975XYP0_9ACTN|nr:MFS transporter [Nocardioides panacis]QWZ06575.1 MFS transporter [Nocardioides panacis]